MVQSSLRLWAAYTLTDIILSHLVYWHKSKFIVIIKSVHQQHHTSSSPASRCLSELFIRKTFFEKCLLSTLYIHGRHNSSWCGFEVLGTQGYTIPAKRRQKPRLLHICCGYWEGALPPLYNICYCPPSDAAPAPNLAICMCAMCK